MFTSDSTNWGRKGEKEGCQRADCQPAREWEESSAAGWSQGVPPQPSSLNYCGLVCLHFHTGSASSAQSSRRHSGKARRASDWHNEQASTASAGDFELDGEAATEHGAHCHTLGTGSRLLPAAAATAELPVEADASPAAPPRFERLALVAIFNRSGNLKV